MICYHTPELTGAGGISATIIGDGCHATLFWYQDKSGNGGEVWKNFRKVLAISKQTQKEWIFKTHWTH